MTEETAAAFQREGEITFPAESTEEDTSADSHSEKEDQKGDTQSSEGDSTQSDAKTPFHEHPRWKERESEWDKRFNDQELRHQDDLKAIREEFGAARKDNAQATQIPKWFGGTQEQWDAYRADRDAELKAAEERAKKEALEQFENKGKNEETKVAEATAYLRSEIVAIESDKTLNPSGAKIDAEKLLKVVLDNELIDSKGRWNYRAGFKILNGTTVAPAPKPKTDDEKKKLAGATTKDTGGGGDSTASSVATSDTFKKSRPW